MSPLKYVLFFVLLATSIMAAALPTASQSDQSGWETITVTATVDPSSSPADPSINCDNQWCQNGTSMCVYWAGVTGWDPSLGPIPGETITTLGSCAMPTTTTTALEPHEVRDNNNLITPAPTTSVDCSYQYCDSSTSYCMYWAGITGYDISLGLIPGMQRTSIGTCAPPTAVPSSPSTLFTRVDDQ